MSALSSMGSGQGATSISEWALKPVQVTQAGNSGAAATGIPIIVPPGRKGIEPRISLNYNSNSGNGWMGIGWGFDMGAIQRSTKRGVNYSANDYAVSVSGSASELVPRGDWGTNYYGVKIESAFSKYYKNPLTGGWEVTTKDGTKYYYGTTVSSRQDSAQGVFKWCLDKVQDTNGNYMTVSYWKDQGEIYLDRIDYTGNTAGLNTTNYVKFYLESRTDAPVMFSTNVSVKTAYRLKRIEVYGNSQLSRKYEFIYNYSISTFRSLLSSIIHYGSDGATALSPITLVWSSSQNGFNINSRVYHNDPVYAYTHSAFADVNGDGKSDAIFWNGSGVLYVVPSNGSGFDINSRVYHNDPVYAYTHSAFADVNGDGKSDAIFWNGSGVLYVVPSNGSGFDINSRVYLNDPVYAYTHSAFTDVNGDGKADAIFWNGSGVLYVVPSNGSGFDINSRVYHNDPVYAYTHSAFADVNGDGKADAIFWNGSGVLYVVPSNGSGFDYNSRAYHNSTIYAYSKSAFTDVNGDGKADAIFWDGNGSGVLYVIPSNGSGFDYNSRAYYNSTIYAYSKSTFADVNGDGEADAIFWDGNGSGILYVVPSFSPLTTPIPDLLSTVTNGIGGTTTIAYQPSSTYTNKLLPFIVQTVSFITVNDGNGISSTTNFTYAGGYFDYADREYRGFQYVKATAPNQTTSETWFEGCNYPPVSGDSIFKGLLEEQITKDSSGNIYTRTYNTFLSTSPYTGINFPYLDQKDDYVYDGTSTAKQATTSFTYDSYGNITRKYLHGDISITDDERDEYTEYTYDTTNWIVSLPSHTYLKDSGGVTRAQAWFTYDVKGSLLTKTDWLNGGTNPVTTYTYDSYGNVTTITDPRGSDTTITYDTTLYTYPWKVTNILGQYTEKNYDHRYGQATEEYDINRNKTSYDYDVFGRLTKVTGPNDGASTYGTISYYYLNFGTLGSQKVVTYATEQSGTGNYIWSEAYFDGLGRTMKTKTEGPDSKVIEAQTIFDDRGLVESESFPYFVNSQGTPLEIPRWRTYQYDPIGRITRTDNPADGTYATSSYLKGVLTYIDPNRHKKVEGKDIYGRIIKIEEYTGASPSFTLYATTAYEYDILGNLKKVTDANNNQSTMTYDTLSRKTSMTDPDMGYWTYQYDANGNLTSQTDAKSQTITFTYDALNRITLKNYTTGTDVTYAYDETFSTYPKGRLTTVTDASGTTKFYYDKLARTTKTIKTVDSTNYTTETSYDALGRVDTLTYPDSTVLKYEYNTGGNLLRVKNNSSGLVYAEYTNYNALGQIGRTDFGNGVNTIYQYLTQNNRLYSITTSKQSTGFVNLSYDYDSIGNITGITDYLDSTRTRTYGYDDLNRLTSATSSSYGGTITWQYNKIGNMTYNSRVGNYTYGAKPHAVTQAGADTYTYDNNGNMTGGAGRMFTYDYDNRVTSVVMAGAATISVYDASGIRVKKVTPGFTTIYIGKHYECTSGVCTKYIFAGSDRIVSIEGSNTRYYHSDHLGSSSVITDQNGISVQSIYYYPYGEMHTNSGSDVAKHKFTGQEYDAETGLYYYNARYYDPRLARFVTADTMVPEPFNPQALNRYSYVLNNPLKYTDPTGHGYGLGEIIATVAIVALIAYLVDQYDNGNVNVGAGASTDGDGKIEPYEPTGSGGGGGGGGADPGSVTVSGGQSGENFVYSSGSGGNPFNITFYNRYSDYDRDAANEHDSINREMLPMGKSNSEKEKSQANGSGESHVSNDSDSAMMRMARGTTFAVEAATYIIFETTWKVGSHVLSDIIVGKTIDFLSRYIRPLQREGTRFAVDLAVDKAINAREAVKFPQTNGHTERLGKIENLNLEVSNERRKWTEEVRQAV